jgi:hypothetical protein
MNNHIKHLANGDFEVLYEAGEMHSDKGYSLSTHEKQAEFAKKREESLQKLSDLGQAMEKAKQEYERKNDEWWNNLTYDERCDAFYAVMKRLYQGEIVEKGSYRYVLYDVFKFGPDMYGAGMDCGYMAIHNSIMDDEQFNEAHKDAL